MDFQEEQELRAEYKELLERIFKESSEHGYLSFYLVEEIKDKIHYDRRQAPANSYFG